MKTYIAVDIGASSGRLIKSQLVNGKIKMEEIHRFKNGFVFSEGYDRWDVEYLSKEILIGLEKLKKQGISECFVGIDTWAVDYCLLDGNGNLIEQPISYRDRRTELALEEFNKKMSLDALYEKTGIQLQPFNTAFQLFVENKRKLKNAEALLLIPDYLGYVFTGKKVMEQTNASTMQLLNPTTKLFDEDILKVLNVSESLFPPIVEAGSILGDLIKEKFSDYDLPDAHFINIASHDTASAVVGTPGNDENWAYISSGTWSLLGVETKVPNVSREAFLANYTNEGGACNTIRFLKNIMGMWLIQEVARMQNYRYSYEHLAELASETPAFQQFVDINHERFLNPENMIVELQHYCGETNQTVPETPGEIARCVYDNLALCYAVELEKLEELRGTKGKITKLHIVGGGSNNRMLNQLTADVAQITVEAGPGEATAIGNLVMQMIVAGDISDVKEARKIIYESSKIHSYQPNTVDPIVLENYKKAIQTRKEGNS